MPTRGRGRGRGRGYKLFNGFREAESFFKWFNGFRGRGKKNESMVFQFFPRLAPVAPLEAIHQVTCQQIGRKIYNSIIVYDTLKFEHKFNSNGTKSGHLVSM